MQCTSYFPGHYSRQDLIGPSNGGPWPISASDISPTMNGQFYDNIYPQQNVDQMRILYHNEVLKQTILNHDNVFRGQVQELHRLHKRQRELMDEFKGRELKEPKIASTSHYNFIFSKASSNCSSTLPWLNPSAFKLSSLSSSTPLSTFNFSNASTQNGIKFENEELKNPKRQRLDLELPCDEYIDIEKVEKKRTFCSKDENLNVFTFDLNLPPTESPESEIFQNIEIENGKKYVIDLNSCVDEDELSQEKVPKIDLEAPVSPENKERLPPRGESEENLIETQVQISKFDDLDLKDDLVKATAETILSFNDRKSAFLLQSLDWFAGVVVSSASFDGSEREENECVVALPSQQGKRYRKRRMNRKILKIETFRSGFKSWGKMNKRRRGSRVPASNIRILWN